MFVLDVYNSMGLTGKQAETILDELNITLNKNQVPNIKNQYLGKVIDLIGKERKYERYYNL